MSENTKVTIQLSRLLQHFERIRQDAGGRLEQADRHERAAWNKIENQLQAFREQLADWRWGSEIVACFLAERLFRDLLVFGECYGGPADRVQHDRPTALRQAESGTHRVAATTLVA